MHKRLCPNIRPGGAVIQTHNGFNFCINFLSAQGPFSVKYGTYRQPAKLFVGGEVLLSSEGTTQGDLLAMPMCAPATMPLVKKIQSIDTNQVWYADDAAAGGSLSSLKLWWNKLTDLGSLFGYFPNAKKSWLVVKPGSLDKAKHLFANTNVDVMNEGRSYLGAALGSRDFYRGYLTEKATHWTTEIEKLCKIALSQSQAANAALTHGLIRWWVYASRTNENFDDFLHPLDKAIQNTLIPEITGRSPPGDAERRLLELTP